MRIYMAGGLFTTAECDFNRALAGLLRGLGYEVFLPQESEQNVEDLNKIFRSDKAGIDWADIVLGNLDGADSDSGTCWELGYGFGTNKTIIVYRTDFRVGKHDIVNLMMTESAHVVLLEPLSSVELLAAHIDRAIKSLPRKVLPAMKNDQFGGFDRPARQTTEIFRHSDK